MYARIHIKLTKEKAILYFEGAAGVRLKDLFCPKVVVTAELNASLYFYTLAPPYPGILIA
jgi:hypothetical protein